MPFAFAMVEPVLAETRTMFADALDDANAASALMFAALTSAADATLSVSVEYAVWTFAVVMTVPYTPAMSFAVVCQTLPVVLKRMAALPFDVPWNTPKVPTPRGDRPTRRR